MSDTAGYDGSFVDEWKCRLDMDKPCGMVGSKETCWLCDDLTGVEPRDERSRLGAGRVEARNCFFCGARSALRRTVNKSTPFAKHRSSLRGSFATTQCIQEIQLRLPSSTVTTRRLRGLYITETSSDRLDFRDLEVVIGLETLYINVDRINQHFAAQIDVLMEHNGATLKKVDIWEYGRTGNRLTKFESLVACECLTLMSPISEVLEYFRMPMSEVSALCTALRVNKTLKALDFLIDGASEVERTSLAQQLLADGCYDRVRLGPWTEPYLRIIAPVLASSLSSAEQIFLPDISALSLDSVTALCNTLPSNRCVSHLMVAVRQEPDAKVALLCEMLKKNRYIERLNIEIEKADSAKEILRALTANAAVNFLYINLQGAANDDTMEAFSGMLSSNKAITDMSVWLEGENAPKFLDSIAKAMSHNRRIISFISRVDCRINVPPSIRESVRRNQCSLNRAVEFVLERREDRRGAECFELFVRTPLYDDPPD
ncbi:hypothetical protein MTO96_045077 [Rhipicephalus appendiculatus]